MQPDFWILSGNMVGHAYISDNHGIYTQPRSGFDGFFPQGSFSGRRKSIQGQKNFGVPFMRISCGLGHFFGCEIQSRKIAGICGVLKSAVNRVGAGIYGGA